MKNKIKLMLKILLSSKYEQDPIHFKCPYCKETYVISTTSIGAREFNEGEYTPFWARLLN